MRGLLEDDAHWDTTTLETVAVQSFTSLRNLLIILLTTWGTSNQEQLSKSHKESLTEDILMQVRKQNLVIDLVYTLDIFNQALIFLEDKVLEIIEKGLKQLGFPAPRTNQGDHLCKEIFRETSYDADGLDKYVSANEPIWRSDQRAAHNAILDQMNKKTRRIFFLDTSDRTGNSFIINLLLAKIRHQSKITIVMASSGIAATLFHGGGTAHSTLNGTFYPDQKKLFSISRFLCLKMA